MYTALYYLRWILGGLAALAFASSFFGHPETFIYGLIFFVLERSFYYILRLRVAKKRQRRYAVLAIYDKLENKEKSKYTFDKDVVHTQGEVEAFKKFDPELTIEKSPTFVVISADGYFSVKTLFKHPLLRTTSANEVKKFISENKIVKAKKTKK